jgi:hypothetical protein
VQELYHPDNWILDENSYYDKLGQAQADLMQKKEKEARKSKVCLLLSAMADHFSNYGKCAFGFVRNFNRCLWESRRRIFRYRLTIGLNCSGRLSIGG